MGRIAIYGASGFGREAAWLAESCGEEPVCFIDDDPEKYGQEVNGIPVLTLGEAKLHFSDAAVVLGIGNSELGSDQEK
jgi:FlaA1/EpsC-like NDP-sugar epimerase